MISRMEGVPFQSFGARTKYVNTFIYYITSTI